MSLFSSSRKSKQEPALDDAPYISRAEEESKVKRSRTKRTQGSAADAKQDPALPEKKRARRRLIGAIALVLAAVIGLPMILDSEPKPFADDIAIRIPSKDKPAGSRSERHAASPTTPKIPPESSLNASLDSAEEFVEPSAKADAPTPAAQHVPAAVGGSAGGPAASKPKEPLASPAKPDIKPVQKADKPDDSARAMALLEGKADPRPAEKKSSKYVVQIAALASKEKVNELQTRLKSAGITSYTQKVATNAGERIRIRVGPFASKDEADKVKAKIGKLGLNGTLIPV